jgi:hypothetical protein
MSPVIHPGVAFVAQGARHDFGGALRQFPLCSPHVAPATTDQVPQGRRVASRPELQKPVPTTPPPPVSATADSKGLTGAEICNC